jgi:hypothetical protein
MIDGLRPVEERAAGLRLRMEEMERGGRPGLDVDQ